MGSGPQLVDFDGDGKLDLVSGSYDPGELYLFRGLGGGKFAAREVIRDKSGKPILKVPDQKGRAESFGSWMTLVDWDGDGDLDILVGTMDGLLFLRRNEGTRTRPVYVTQNEWVRVGSKLLRVPGRHANVVIADWDGDGLWDIITGSADGGVYWYRNVGKQGQPRFAGPVALIPRHEGFGMGELLDAREQPRPGIRSQIAVVDYDADGKLDILLGDYCTNLHIKKDLTSQQRRAFEAARERRARSDEAVRRNEEVFEEWCSKMQKALLQANGSARLTSELRQKINQQIRDSSEFKKRLAENEALITEYEKTNAELKKYMEPTPSGDGRPVTHGYVWLFRRK